MVVKKNLDRKEKTKKQTKTKQMELVNEVKKFCDTLVSSGPATNPGPIVRSINLSKDLNFITPTDHTSRLEDEGQELLWNDFTFNPEEEATDELDNGTEFHVTINVEEEIPILITFFEEQYLSLENATILENAVIPLAQSELQVDKKFHKNIHTLKDFIVLIKKHHTQEEYSISII